MSTLPTQTVVSTQTHSGTEKKHYSNDSKTQKHTATAKLFLRGPCNVVFGNVKKRLATQETKFKAACKPEKIKAQQSLQKIKIARRLSGSLQHNSWCYSYIK
jgi:hypothetical protein